MTIPNTARNLKNGTAHKCAGMNVKCYSHLQNSLAVSYKMNHKNIKDLEIVLNI